MPFTNKSVSKSVCMLDLQDLAAIPSSLSSKVKSRGSFTPLTCPYSLRSRIEGPGKSFQPFPLTPRFLLPAPQLTFVSVPTAEGPWLLLRSLAPQVALYSIAQEFSTWLPGSGFPKFHNQEVGELKSENKIPKGDLQQENGISIYTLLLNSLHTACAHPIMKCLYKCITFLSKRHTDSNPGSKRGTFSSLLRNFYYSLNNICAN